MPGRDVQQLPGGGGLTSYSLRTCPLYGLSYLTLFSSHFIGILSLGPCILCYFFRGSTPLAPHGDWKPRKVEMSSRPDDWQWSWTHLKWNEGLEKPSQNNVHYCYPTPIFLSQIDVIKYIYYIWCIYNYICKNIIESSARNTCTCCSFCALALVYVDCVLIHQDFCQQNALW